MKNKSFKDILISNAVPIIFLVLSAAAIPLSGFTTSYLIQEMVTRMGRNCFLVLSLLIPIAAGMGLNFGMVLGAMGGQIAIILVTDWNIVGMQGLLLAAMISTPISLALGWLTGEILNRAKGREMVTSFMLGFFMNGVYQFIVLYGFGMVIPVENHAMLLSRGFGIRNAINLQGVRQVLDKFLMVDIGPIHVPMAAFIVIALFCLFILWFNRTKLGQDMRAVGQDMAVAKSAGIAVDRTRIIAIIISTVLAGYGQIIFLQNIGTMNTYNAHEQAGIFAIASLLIGGATVSRATITNVFVGVLLFHLMFVVSPMAGKTLMGQAQLGEYFRVFVSYGIIALALVLHALRRRMDKERERQSLRGGESPAPANGH